MKTWMRFNLVGAMGMAVQFAALALFSRLAPRHYLCATAAAIELALLHNFVWHAHYTWRDRRVESTRCRQFVRFHLSAGLVSLAGNLLLMELLTRNARLPLVRANLIATLCCALVNFCLVNAWVFRRSGASTLQGCKSIALRQRLRTGSVSASRCPDPLIPQPGFRTSLRRRPIR